MCGDKTLPELVVNSLLDAIQKEKPNAGLIIYTDQGWQYNGSSCIS